jgi:hypothetical protein
MTARLTDEQLADVDVICDTTDLGVAPAIVRLLLAELRTLRAAASGLESFVRDLADEDCDYNDECPSSARHYVCRRCQAKRAIHRLTTAKEM